VDDDVLKNARPVAVTVHSFEHEQTQTHAFKFSVEEEGTSTSNRPSVKAVGGFPLPETYDAISPCRLCRAKSNSGNGASCTPWRAQLLDQIARRRRIEYEIARVAANQINHLVTQTNGSFENPEFFGEFDEEKHFAHCDRHQSSISRTIQGELFRVRFLQSSPGSADAE